MTEKNLIEIDIHLKESLNSNLKKPSVLKIEKTENIFTITRELA
jgi:hypothetical protein